MMLLLSYYYVFVFLLSSVAHSNLQGGACAPMSLPLSLSNRSTLCTTVSILFSFTQYCIVELFPNLPVAVIYVLPNSVVPK